MTVSQADHKRARLEGKATAMAHLTGVIRAGMLPTPLTDSYATGMAEGIGEVVAAYVSHVAAVEALTGPAGRHERAVAAAAPDAGDAVAPLPLDAERQARGPRLVATAGAVEGSPAP